MMKQVNTIKGFEDIKDYYYVTSEGEVYGYSGKMKPQNNRGYKFVRLYTEDGKFKDILVHRLIASAFIPNPENKPQVNHLDESPSNNHVNNLEWVTNQENMEYSRAYTIIGTCMKTQKTIRFKSMSEAARNGFNQGNISSCINGKRKQHKGYTWSRDNAN